MAMTTGMCRGTLVKCTPAILNDENLKLSSGIGGMRDREKERRRTTRISRCSPFGPVQRDSSSMLSGIAGADL